MVDFAQLARTWLFWVRIEFGEWVILFPFFLFSFLIWKIRSSHSRCFPCAKPSLLVIAISQIVCDETLDCVSLQHVCFIDLFLKLGFWALIRLRHPKKRKRKAKEEVMVKLFLLWLCRDLALLFYTFFNWNSLSICSRASFL